MKKTLKKSILLLVLGLIIVSCGGGNNQNFVNEPIQQPTQSTDSENEICWMCYGLFGEFIDELKSVDLNDLDAVNAAINNNPGATGEALHLKELSNAGKLTAEEASNYQGMKTSYDQQLNAIIQTNPNSVGATLLRQNFIQ